MALQIQLNERALALSEKELDGSELKTWKTGLETTIN